ncbi:2-phospho-L-lactate guanylyltransferase [Catenulispora subtropica]|uniref:Phosphoenolpyruvate guanylyltransferase n=1 Tax=Catenulispora subtropica TaxID=450798 RepID=A0ABN2RYH3_9ACTN
MPRSAPSDETPWCLVVPVKRLGRAKSRLIGADVPPELRERLALAFATDAVTAALSATRVAGVLVVTDDPTAAAVLGALGAKIVPDAPDAGLNAAFAFGAGTARRIHGDGIGVAASAADLPALRGAELDIALARVAGDKRHFIADAHDIGTTMLFAPPGTDLDPRFGGPSRAAHTASGAVELPGTDISSLRRDVDTPADLVDALRLGVGPATAAVWAAGNRAASGV